MYINPQRIAPTVEARAGRSGYGDFATSGGLVETAPTINARTRGGGGGGGGGGTDFECDGGVIPIQEVGKRQSGTPMNGVGHGEPGDPMFTLQANAQHGDFATITKNYATHHGRTAGNSGGVAENQLIPEVTTVDAQNKVDRGDSQHLERLIPEVAWALQERDSKGSDSKGSDSKGSDSKGSDSKGSDSNTKDGHLLPMSSGNQWRVRRLTPKETCRLQGFHDDFLDIEYNGKPAKDSPKYKAIGNSMAVPVVHWILKRIDEVHKLNPQ